MKTYSIDYINTEQAIDAINKIRLISKSEWYIVRVNFKSDCIIIIKAYKTSIQVFKTEFFKESTPCDIKVADFKKYLDKCITYYFERKAGTV